jgi:hypothetical protein
MAGMVEGINPEGFNKLQSIIPFIGKVPPKTPEDFLLFKLFETIFWAVYISTFKEGAIKELSDIMGRPEFSPK